VERPRSRCSRTLHPEFKLAPTAFGCQPRLNHLPYDHSALLSQMATDRAQGRICGCGVYPATAAQWVATAGLLPDASEPSLPIWLATDFPALRSCWQVASIDVVFDLRPVERGVVM